jgi:cell division cycle 2-like
MNNRGEIKVADFGMARYFGDPPPANLTQLVVTLWYRAPELLLGTDRYDQAIDIWSLGCIFGELLQKEPLLQGRNEVDELSKVRHILPRQTRLKVSYHKHTVLFADV